MERPALGFILLPWPMKKTLQTWTHTFIFGYGLPPDWGKPLLTMMTSLGLDLPMRNYLGYLDGRPVATSSFFLSAGVAGVQFVATLPEARGQGLGGTMSLTPLLEARPMGYHIGILQSSGMGFGVYRRLGFQTVCHMEHFYWNGESGEQWAIGRWPFSPARSSPEALHRLTRAVPGRGASL